MARVIPKHDFSVAFQTKLVRAFYQFPEEGGVILTGIDAGIFDTDPLQWCVRKMQDILAKTGVPVTDTILEHEAVVDAKLGVIPEGHIPAYAGLIRRLRKPVPDKTFLFDKAFEYVRFVSMREAVISLAGMLTDPSTADYGKAAKIFSQQASLGDERSDGSLGQDFFGDIDGRIKRRSTVELTGIPTGTPVDQHLRHGGLPPKQLGVVMAPTGRGKTAMLVWFGGSAIKAGKRVLHITVELDEDMVAERYDARFSRFRLQSLNARADDVRSRLGKIARRYQGSLRVKFFPPDTLTVGKLRGFIKRLEAVSFYPDLLILDYADNMNLQEFGKTSDSDYGPLGRLYISLRGVAGELNIPIWTASQTSRGSLEKEDIGLADLADSFRKAMVADVIIGVAQTPEEQVRKLARLFTAKNRNGPSGKIDIVQFDPGRVRIWTE